MVYAGLLLKLRGNMETYDRDTIDLNDLTT
jgi:hypothetical protein